MLSQAGRDIITIGASLGGVEAISRLVAQLPVDLPAAVFIVQHVSPYSAGLFASILNRAGSLPAKMARDGEPIRRGAIYVAPPDHHLLLKPDATWVVHGPRENHCRPAIDPLFRSAAVAFGPRVVGVVLTGLLADGTAGLLAVKRCSGTAVVQDPEDAQHPDMPRNALAAVAVDFQVPLDEMGQLLTRLARSPAPEPHPIPEDILVEARIMEHAMNNLSSNEGFGPLTAMTCPDCGGALREVEDPELPRFRCHLGHAFTEETLLNGQAEAVEQAIWAALRSLRERAHLLTRMAQHARERDRMYSAADYQQQAAETITHADALRGLLRRSTTNPESKSGKPSENERTAGHGIPKEPGDSQPSPGEPPA